MQQLRDEPLGHQPEAGPPVQEPDPVRPPLRRHGPHGELGLHAAAAELQAPESGLRRRPEEELRHPHIPTPASGMLR